MVWFKRIVLVLVGLITLVACLFVAENWRGKHAWATWQREREAQGDRYEWTAVLPSPVPDDQNFAAIPLFAELFPKPPTNPALDAVRLPNGGPAAANWRLDRPTDLAGWRACFTNDNLLAALSRYEPILAEIESAAQRPHTHFPIRYEDNISILLPHLPHLRHLARVFSLRASAQLEAGNPGAAWQDVRLCLRLADALKDEPVLISFLVRRAILELALQPIWEGVRSRSWQQPQLAAIQMELVRFNEIERLYNALQGERRFAYGAVREHERVPAGWSRQNLLFLDRVYVEKVLPSIHAKEKHLDVSTLAKVSAHFEKTTLYNTMASFLMPEVAAASRRTAMTQSGLDQAIVACALERYRLTRAELPGRLEELVPALLVSVPLDVVDGQPLRYRPSGTDKFMLWSVGWNQTDDAGQVVLDGKRQQDDQGDWVWQN